jgi:hypothetical protein
VKLLLRVHAGLTNKQNTDGFLFENRLFSRQDASQSIGNYLVQIFLTYKNKVFFLLLKLD